MVWREKRLQQEDKSRRRTEKSVDFKLTPEKKKKTALEELKATLKSDEKDETAPKAVDIDQDPSIPEGFYDRISMDGFTVKKFSPTKRGILRNGNRPKTHHQYRQRPQPRYEPRYDQRQERHFYDRRYDYEDQQPFYRHNPSAQAMAH